MGQINGRTNLGHPVCAPCLSGPTNPTDRLVFGLVRKHSLFLFQVTVSLINLANQQEEEEEVDLLFLFE